jgi:hypothetical protein
MSLPLITIGHLLCWFLAAKRAPAYLTTNTTTTTMTITITTPNHGHTGCLLPSARGIDTSFAVDSLPAASLVERRHFTTCPK